MDLMNYPPNGVQDGVVYVGPAKPVSREKVRPLC